MTALSPKLLALLEQVRAIAQEGLHYCKNPYDITRFERLLDIAVAEYAEAFKLDPALLKARFEQQTGIVTPKTGADAIVPDEQNRILVLKRSDDQTWCLPCGWLDIQENPAEAAMRETREETGIDVEALSYLSILQKGPHTAAHVTYQLNVLVLMKTVPADTIITLSHEHTDYRWIDAADDLPFHPGHDEQVKTYFTVIENKQKGIPIS